MIYRPIFYSHMLLCLKLDPFMLRTWSLQIHWSLDCVLQFIVIFMMFLLNDIEIKLIWLIDNTYLRLMVHLKIVSLVLGRLRPRNWFSLKIEMNNFLLEWHTKLCKMERLNMSLPAGCILQASHHKTCWIVAKKKRVELFFH